MRIMNVDIETYSSVDIKTAGAYAYAEAPDFEILLIAYKIDDGPVKVLDLKTGRPKQGNLFTEKQKVFKEDCKEFYKALTDADYIKTAYNANFERTCMASFLGMYGCTCRYFRTTSWPGCRRHSTGTPGRPTKR